MAENRKRMVQYTLVNEKEGRVQVRNLDDSKDTFEFLLSEAVPRVWLIWNTLDESEQYAILYGIRQSTSDGGSAEKTGAGKLALIRKKYNKYFVERQIHARESGVGKVKVDREKVKAKARELAAKFGLTEERAEEMAMELLS